MSSIKTYDDLLAEEKRLQALLYSHKESIKTSFIATKESLNPVKAAVNTVKSLFTRSKTNPLMKVGVDFGVDVFLRRFVLAKAGWFTKIVLPFVVKNYSTYILKERRNISLLSKITGLFKPRKSGSNITTGDFSRAVKGTGHAMKENAEDLALTIREEADIIQEGAQDIAQDTKETVRDTTRDIKNSADNAL